MPGLYLGNVPYSAMIYCTARWCLMPYVPSVDDEILIGHVMWCYAIPYDIMWCNMMLYHVMPQCVESCAYTVWWCCLIQLFHKMVSVMLQYINRLLHCTQHATSLSLRLLLHYRRQLQDRSGFRWLRAVWLWCRSGSHEVPDIRWHQWRRFPLKRPNSGCSRAASWSPNVQLDQSTFIRSLFFFFLPILTAAPRLSDAITKRCLGGEKVTTPSPPLPCTVWRQAQAVKPIKSYQLGKREVSKRLKLLLTSELEWVSRIQPSTAPLYWGASMVKQGPHFITLLQCCITSAAHAITDLKLNFSSLQIAWLKQAIGSYLWSVDDTVQSYTVAN